MASTAVLTGTAVPGQLLTGYSSQVLTVEELLEDRLPGETEPYRLVLTSLAVTVPVYVRVTSHNDRGWANPMNAVPASAAPPAQRPDVPTAVSVAVHTGTALRVFWHSPESDGGDSITKYKIEWDVDGGFPGGPAAGSYELKVSAGACGNNPCEHLIGGLAKGVPVFVRVWSYNAFGYCVVPTQSVPLSETPRTQPLPPAAIRTSPNADGRSLGVYFSPTADAGGAPVTQYKIEWDVMGQDAVWAGSLSSEVLYNPYDVQTITVSADAFDISGTFMLSFEGHTTDWLSTAITADDLRQALEAVPTLGSVLVSRRVVGFGYEWAVTFLGNDALNEDATIPTPTLSSLQVSSDGTAFGDDATGGNLVGTNTKVEVVETVSALLGFETQLLQVVSSDTTPVGGTFTLSHAGASTLALPADASAPAVKAALEATTTTGALRVERWAIPGGFRWLIVFLDRLGAQAMITVNGAGLTPAGSSAAVTPDETGRVPAMASSQRGSLTWTVPTGSGGSHAVPAALLAAAPSLSYAVNLTGLTPGAAYVVKVSAFNGVGDVYGPTAFSVPALAYPVRAPSAPSIVSTEVLSPSAVAVTWEAPAALGGADLLSYVVDWDTNGGLREVQRVDLMSVSLAGVSGTFQLSYGVHKTRPLPFDASGDAMKAALEGLAPVGTVDVVRSAVAAGYSWTVTFTSNTGDLPTLAPLPAGLLGSPALTVTQVRAGTDPSFDSGTVGVNVLPLGSAVVARVSEIQTVTVTAGAEDLDGSFFLIYRGEMTHAIPWTASPEFVKAALEDLSKIGRVDVTARNLTLSSPLPFTRFGREWAVTFISETGNVPSLLVSTNDGATATVHASHGLPEPSNTGLRGTTPRVGVTETRRGSLPTTTTIAGNLAALPHYVRVSAIGPGGRSGFTLAGTTALPSKQPPQPPVGARVSSLGTNEIGVSWRAPLHAGGEAVTKYALQWDTTPDFTSVSVRSGALYNLTLAPGADTYTYVISGVEGALTPGVPYYVRVMAYNARGYGGPALADRVPIDEDGEVQELSWTASASFPTVTLVSVSDLAPSSYVTLDADASPREVQEALEALPSIAPGDIVGITRTDLSTAYDASTVGTAAFGFAYRITFRPLHLVGDVPDIAFVDRHDGQVLTISSPAGTPSAGTFALTLGAATTSCIPLTADATAIQNAISTGLNAGLAVAASVTVAPLASVNAGFTSFRVTFNTVVAKLAAGMGVATGAPCAAFVPASAAVSVRREVVGDSAVAAGTASLSAFTHRAFRADGGVVPLAAPPAIPLDISLTIVTAQATGVSFTLPSWTGSGAGVDKFRIEWDTSRLFVRDNSPTWSHLFSLASCNIGASPACLWDAAAGSFQYEIGDGIDGHFLTTDVPYFFRVSAHGPGGWGVAKVSTPVAIAPVAQAPHLPEEVYVEVSRIDIAPQLDVWFKEPNVNVLNYPTTSGGSPVTAYRIEWDPRDTFNSAAGGGAFAYYDAPMTGACSSLCTVSVGANVQAFSHAALTTVTAGGFRLSFAGQTTACLAFDAADSDVQTALRGLSTINVNGVPGVTVTRSGDGTAASNFGYTWRVTFVSEALSLENPLLTATFTSCPAFTGTNPTFSQPYHVLPGGMLVPGTPYFVRVSAINAVGRGPALPATVINEAGAGPSVRALPPRAPATMPLGTIVEALVDSSTTLRLYWLKPASNEGARIMNYIVEWALASAPTTIVGQESVAVGTGTPHPQDGPFVHVFPTDPAAALTPGSLYVINIRAVNDQGPGDWATFTPRCQAGLENCSPLIVPRALPLAPTVEVSLQGNGPLFTHNTLSLYFDTDVTEQGGGATVGTVFADKYKIEWDTVDTFDSANGLPLSFSSSRLEILPECSNPALCVGTSPEVSPLGVQVLSIVHPGAGTVSGRIRLSYASVDAATCFDVTDTADNLAGLLLSAFGHTVTVKRSAVVQGGYSYTITYLSPAAPTDVLRARLDNSCPSAVASGSGVVRALPKRPAYVITGLTQGTVYYIRVTAHNTLGYGAVSQTHVAKPHREPSRANLVSLSVLDADEPAVGTSLRVGWQSPDDAGGDPITHYRVEWAEAAWSTAVTTVQTIRTQATSPLGGTFRVWVDTRGAAATTCGNPNMCPVQALHVSADMPFDVSPSVMATTLMNLPNVDPVTVVRSDVDLSLGLYAWTITFTSQVTRVPALVPDGALLSGAGAYVGVCAGGSATPIDYAGATSTFSCAGLSVQGVPPSQYRFSEVRVQDLGLAPFRYDITGLVPGREYWVRVAARHALGYGMMKEAAPLSLWPPKQPPTAPTSPFHSDGLPVMDSTSSTSLLIQWGPPESDGGDAVLKFKVEVDVSPDFDTEVDPLNGNHDSAVHVFFVDYDDSVAPNVWEVHVTGLTVTKTYWARVSAYNAARGYGPTTPTFPTSLLLSQKPSAVALLNATVVSSTAVQLAWAPSSANAAPVTNYAIEWFQMYIDPPFFGVSEVQTLSTSCDGGSTLGGYFTVSYGDYVLQLPGTVTAIPGVATITSTVDLAPHLRRGDIVKVGDEVVMIAGSGGVVSNVSIPLSTGYGGPGGPELPVFRRYTTEPIPFDVDNDGLQARLQHLFPIGIIRVTSGGGPTACGARSWLVTFVTDENSPGPKQTLVVNGNLLTGGGASMGVAASRAAGMPPRDYHRDVINATSLPSYLIRDLTPGTRYYARVSGINARGQSMYFPAAPADLSFVPKSVPGAVVDAAAVTAASVAPWNATALLVTFDESADPAGDVITAYRVSVDSRESVGALVNGTLSADFKSIVAPVTNRIQKVVVDARFAPISGTFTLSFGGFRGDLTRRVGGNTALFDVASGDDEITTPNDVTAWVRDADLFAHRPVRCAYLVTCVARRDVVPCAMMLCRVP